MKKTSVLLIILSILIVCTLTFIGLNLKKQNKPYVDLEETLKFKAESMIGANPSLIKELNSKITLASLKENGYEVDTKVNDDTCEGYVLIEKEGQVLKYNPYIKCQKYETKGYTK